VEVEGPVEGEGEDQAAVVEAVVVVEGAHLAVGLVGEGDLGRDDDAEVGEELERANFSPALRSSTRPAAILASGRP
jgi:hypothetical protein